MVWYFLAVRHWVRDVNRTVLCVEIPGNRRVKLGDDVTSVTCLMHRKAMPIRGITFHETKEKKKTKATNEDDYYCDAPILIDETLGETLKRVKHGESFHDAIQRRNFAQNQQSRRSSAPAAAGGAKGSVVQPLKQPAKNTPKKIKSSYQKRLKRKHNPAVMMNRENQDPDGTPRLEVAKPTTTDSGNGTEQSLPANKISPLHPTPTPAATTNTMPTTTNTNKTASKEDMDRHQFEALETAPVTIEAAVAVNDNTTKDDGTMHGRWMEGRNSKDSESPPTLPRRSFRCHSSISDIHHTDKEADDIHPVYGNACQPTEPSSLPPSSSRRTTSPTNVGTTMMEPRRLFGDADPHAKDDGQESNKSGNDNTESDAAMCNHHHDHHHDATHGDTTTTTTPVIHIPLPDSSNTEVSELTDFGELWSSVQDDDDGDDDDTIGESSVTLDPLMTWVHEGCSGGEHKHHQQPQEVCIRGILKVTTSYDERSRRSSEDNPPAMPPRRESFVNLEYYGAANDEEEDAFDTEHDSTESTLDFDETKFLGLFADDDKEDDIDKAQDARLSEQTRLRFGIIEVREYTQCLGDNPACSTGPPIQLSWEYQVAERHSVDDFERMRQPERRGDVSLRIPNPYRQYLLLKLGYTPAELAKANRLKTKAQQQRVQTIARLDYMKYDERVESMTRKIMPKNLPQMPRIRTSGGVA